MEQKCCAEPMSLKNLSTCLNLGTYLVHLCLEITYQITSKLYYLHWKGTCLISVLRRVLQTRALNFQPFPLLAFQRGFLAILNDYSYTYVYFLGYSQLRRLTNHAAHLVNCLTLEQSLTAPESVFLSLNFGHKVHAITALLKL